MFESKSLNAKKIIYDNILILSKLISKINHQLAKIDNWAMIRIENYFDIEVNNQPLSNQEVSQISSFFSPIIYEILQRIFLGSFDMNKFYFEIKDK